MNTAREYKSSKLTKLVSSPDVPAHADKQMLFRRVCERTSGDENNARTTCKHEGGGMPLLPYH